MAGYTPVDEISFNNREDYFTIPVPAQEFELYTPGQNQSWNTTDAGPFKAIGHPGLKSLTYTSFFPAQHYPFCACEPMLPEKYIEKIQRYQQSRRPIRFIRAGVENGAYAIEGFTFSKEMGTGDINFTLELEQYRFASETNPETGNSYRDGYTDELADEQHIWITLQEGQTLCELAEKYLGDSDRYKDIAEWNDIEDVGHPWAATAPHHQLEIICEEGTPGYDMRVEENESGKGLG